MNSIRLLFSFRQVTCFVVLLGVFPSAAFSQQPAADDQPGPTTAKRPDVALQAPPQSAPSNPDAKPELTIQDSGTTFQLRVNLVQVHVIVRDSSGKPVPNLRKEDFLLYDQGKLQPVTTFAVETRLSRLERSEAAAKTQVDSKESQPSAVSPDRFVALVFDDLHLTQQDANFARTQTYKFINGVPPTDRIGIFSTSGQTAHEFTADNEALKQTLAGLISRPHFDTSANGCPDITFYEADQILNYHNTQMVDALAVETISCSSMQPEKKFVNGKVVLDEEGLMNRARSIVQTQAMPALAQGDADVQFVYRFMVDVLGHLAGMPGERVMVLVSPGFLMTAQNLDLMSVVDRANRSNIVINTLDARGVYTTDLAGDISRPPNYVAKTTGYRSGARVSAQAEQTRALADFAYGTGGTFVGNSNDLAAGLSQLGAAPEVSYVLGFSPQNEKMDGSYHTLKVTLAQKGSYTLQARRGYFAPRHSNNAAQQAHDEIEEALLSRDEIVDLPLQLQTQYFKSGADEARLSVISRLDLKGVHFRKTDGRSLDSLTVTTAIFDNDGNFVTGNEKVVEMRLLDATYEKLSRNGLLVKSSFDLKPGRYTVRQVVRASEGGQMAAGNGAVEIPN